MLRPVATLVALSLAGSYAASQADQLVIYRDLVDGEPQGAGQFFEVSERLFVRVALDRPLPDTTIGLQLVRNATSVFDKPLDLKGETSQFDLRLRKPDGRPFQPGVYKLTITQADRVVAETTFLVGYRLPPRQPRIYWGPPVPEGADPFAQADAPAGAELLPPEPTLGALVVFRQGGEGQLPDVQQHYTTGDKLIARLTLNQPVADGGGYLELVRDGEVMSEGDIDLREKTVFDISLVTDVGFPPGAYVLTITAGERVLGEARFTVQEPPTG